MKAGAHPELAVVLTVRPPHSDFRLPLARELARRGIETWHVFLKRRPEARRLSPDGASLALAATGWPALWRLAGRWRGSRGVVLNATNLAFPATSLLLGLRIGGTRCFDLHDDLRYDRAGLARLRADLAQRGLVATSDLAVHAAPTLAELFPRSHHLGNASEVEPGRRERIDAERVLVLASLDARLDFALLDAVAAAAPGRVFDVHGRVGAAAAATRAALNRLVAARANVRWHGPYRAEDLTALLAPYSVALAPYVANSSLTRRIDPLRYYHCLRAGLEVISTDIPAARGLSGELHVVGSAAEIVATLDRLAADPSSRRNADPEPDAHGWAARAERFLAILAAASSGRER